MTSTAGNLVDRLLSAMDEEGYVTTPDGPDTYVVSQPGHDVLRLNPRLVVPEDVVAEYMDNVGDIGEPAFGIVVVNVVECFDVDHGGGNNYTQLVAFRRGPSGQAELHVEQDVPDHSVVDDAGGFYEWRA